MGNSIKATIIAATLICLSLDSFAQGNNSYSLFQLLYSGKKQRLVKEAEIHGTGSIIKGDSVLIGSISIKPNKILLNYNGYTREFEVNDESITKIGVSDSGGQTLEIMRLHDRDKELWRVLKDTLGFGVYDKNTAFVSGIENIDYETLLFRKESTYQEAFTFWTTSTKKNIIKILNSYLGLALNPKSFRGKEEVMDKLLNGELE